MKDDTMNDMAPIDKDVTPLSVFQNELLKFKGGQKRKSFLTIVLPIIVIALLVGGYFTYFYFKIKHEKQALNADLANIIKLNEAILAKNQQEGSRVPDALVTDANKKIEETKINGKYGVSREEIDKLRNASQ
jgi:hypothetical protein